ncbi:MAG: hypothetical protein IPP15_13650 [Saprospiraceae bacterium]|uniref:Uncharacterized protein n=1 Tax=Candidatus Opimibacter skivensis TaxID=2982028 RepID=A0A9D7SWV7_9BACT|nr:hypothetical protein [Candidatus Opimibacter skivensis]
MFKYGYYILGIIYTLFLLYSLFTYITKPTPTGDATVDWARGIFFSAGLLVILIIGLLFWKRPTIGFIIFCIPLIYMTIPFIRQKMTDIYAAAPPLKSVPPLTLTIKNMTKAKVHVQLSCWFKTSQEGTVSLYKTMDYTSEPLASNDYTFTNYETNLLATKSSYVSVMMYEHIMETTNEVSYEKEIQPCMYFYDEQIEAFGKGQYIIVIDSTKNTKTFKETVEQLKGQGMYDKGVF